MSESTQAPGVALITGASFRIGRAIAEHLARNGWAVGIHYRKSKDAAEDIVARLKAEGCKAAAIGGDLADIGAVADLIPRCKAALGAPTCLINNASEFHDDSLETASSEQWDVHMSANLKAPVFLAQSFAKHLPDGANGNIINIVDQRVLNIRPEYFSYSISKAALWTATKMLAQELAPRIRVNAIGPGPVLQSIHQSEQDFADEWAKTPLRKPPSPHEIANAALYLLSAEAVTGQMIALDSGQHLV